MNRSLKVKKRKQKLIIVVVMFILCIAAVAYIFRLAGSNAGSSGSNDEGAGNVSEDMSLATESVKTDADQVAESANKETTYQRIYAYSGTGDNERFTFEAYDSAIEAGAGTIVMDMVVSASGTPYVAPDDYAKDMTGYSGYFSGMTDEQIGGITTRGGNKVLSVGEVFDKYGDSVNYVVCVKYESARNTDAFIDLVKKYGNEDNVSVMCPYLDMLGKIAGSFPDMTKIYYCQDQAGFNSANSSSNVDILSVDKSIMTEDNCKSAHDSGKKFNVQTVNTGDEIKSAIKIGVDSYFTDEAVIAAGIEKE